MVAVDGTMRSVGRPLRARARQDLAYEEQEEQFVPCGVTGEPTTSLAGRQRPLRHRRGGTAWRNGPDGRVSLRPDGTAALLALPVSPADRRPEPQRSVGCATANLVLWLRNPVELLGLESMVCELGHSVRSFSDDLAAAIEAAAEQQPGMLVVALRDVDEAARALLGSATAGGARLLVLIEELTDLARLTGIRCSGFARTSDLDAALLRVTLDRVLAGDMPMPAEVAHHLVEAATADLPAGRAGTQVRLTPREQQTLILLVDGLSNKQIANRLGVSGHGAKRLVANILAKLDCSNRTLAVAKALREGIYERYA